jgi:hypothetical protein
MIASLLWKEYREHRAVWATLAVVGAAAIVGLPRAFPPEPAQEQLYRDGLAGVAVALAWAYGIVCGSMLLAGESENGTQGYLDLLPAGRLPLWLAKTLAGGLFVLLQVAVLFGLGSLQGLLPLRLVPAGALALLYAGALGLGWGLCCSARGKSVLSSIGWAIFTQLLLVPVLQLICLIPLVLNSVATGREIPQAFAILLGATVAVVLPWPVSALRYSSQDRERAPFRARRDRSRPAPDASWRASFWLARRQVRGFGRALVLFCLAAGFPVAAMGLVLWPVFSLVVGVLCGVTVFFDEQGGPYRFLGDQRLPLTRFWLVKAGLRLGVGLLGLAALLVPSVLALLVDLGQHPLRLDQGEAILGRLFHAPLVGLTIPAGLFLFTPTLYGFALGHVCGVVFRKALVAVVVAFGLSILLLTLWAPSFVAGGLRAWQVLLVPLVLVAGARLLLRPWSTDRLLSRATAARLGAIVFASVALTVAGLWYRVAEIPDVPEPEGFRAFVAGLPKPEENEAGQAVRAGLTRLEALSREWRRQNRENHIPDRESFMFQTSQAAQNGWPVDPDAGRRLGAWLDGVFADDWCQRLAEARGKPVGVVDDPRLRTVTAMPRSIEPVLDAGKLLPARGLMLQQNGDPAAFVENLDTALTMVRIVENANTEMFVLVAQSVETLQLTALERWLEALPNRGEVLRRAGEVLARHRDWRPPTAYDVELVEYLLGLNSLEQMQEWLKQRLGPLGGRGVTLDPELLAYAWRVPWEQERQLRLLRAFHWGRAAIPQGAMEYLWIVTPRTVRSSGHMRSGHLRRLAALEAARLRVALRLYQAEQGHPAKTLDALVPKYLPAVPADPFDGNPFRYRLSEGEEIGWTRGNAPEEERMRAVPKGQGILWSVGEDGHDDGGKQQQSGDLRQPGQDIIYLVPLPAKR